ncbi:hypothetical protein NPIL_218181 [Nephila pilipes]|uniref:Uncharacterized protein n=1 Tax=Nephila pilipes TaxID=299642 RepID=A0A8X6TTC8_NEPPI|nr:hypothetical protein NPIL_218181 [Nephila pilipes]
MTGTGQPLSSHWIRQRGGRNLPSAPLSDSSRELRSTRKKISSAVRDEEIEERESSLSKYDKENFSFLGLDCDHFSFQRVENPLTIREKIYVCCLGFCFGSVLSGEDIE